LGEFVEAPLAGTGGNCGIRTNFSNAI